MHLLHSPHCAGEVNTGQRRKAAVRYIDSVEEPKLLDLAELLIFPLKLGKASKVSGSTTFHGVKSDSYAPFKTTVKMLWVKRTTPLVELEKAHFFSEWQEINILCITTICTSANVGKWTSIFLQGTNNVSIYWAPIDCFRYNMGYRRHKKVTSIPPGSSKTV